MLSMSLSDNLRRSVELAAEKGSSTWLTALPIEDQGFTMHKGEFQDALSEVRVASAPPARKV